jgi:mutator protein MutT
MTPAGDSASERVEIAVAVVEHEGRYLIGQRPAATKLAGYWEFPGGKIEPGESAAQAAMRECQEETGLAIRIIGQHSVVEHSYEHGELRLHFLRATCHGPMAPLPARFRWVSADQLSDYTFPAANAALLLELSARTTG